MTGKEYNEKPDDPSEPREQTVHLSIVSLLGIAEATFGLLVFTVTGIPKAFNSLGVTNLGSSIKGLFSNFSSRLTRKESYISMEERDQISLEKMQSVRPSREAPHSSGKSSSQHRLQQGELSTTNATTTPDGTQDYKRNMGENAYIV